MVGKQKPKRLHHHVWQFYLRPWTRDGAIWVLQDGHIFSTGTRRVAVERDFYKFTRLSASDVVWIKQIIAKSHPEAQRSALTLLRRMMVPFQLVDEMGGSEKSDSISTHLDEYCSQVLEELHTEVESRFIPLLKDALQGDLHFYDDQRCIAFLDFITKQYMRTKGVKERIAANIDPVGHASMRRAWGFLSFIFAQNIGMSLFLERKRRRLLLVRNKTEIPFVTGDQPIINLHAKGSETESLTFFYPISPVLALWLGEVDEASPYAGKDLTPTDVMTLNSEVAKFAYHQIFADDRTVLMSIK